MKTGPFNVMRHNDWDRVPRDPGTIGAFIINAIAGAGTVAATSWVAIAVGYVATTVVTAFVTAALTPKPDLSAAGGVGGLTTNIKEPNAARQYVYGQVRKGGVITYLKSTGDKNKYLHMVLTVAAHEVEELGQVYVNDQPIESSPYNSKIRIKKHLGNQTAPDQDLVNEAGVPVDFIGYGIAYLYIRMEYDQEVFANGVPLFTVLVKGKKVFDPATSTTAWSSNPALCIRDYLSANNGLKVPASRLDDTYFTAAKLVCNETVDVVGGTQNRYEMHGVVSGPIKSTLERLVTSCGGTIWRGTGGWKLKAGAYTTPVKTLGISDLRSGLNIVTRSSLRDNYNAVIGQFNDKAQDYIVADYPKVIERTSAGSFIVGKPYTILELGTTDFTSIGASSNAVGVTFVATGVGSGTGKASLFFGEDNGVENSLSLDLPYTTDSQMAQRIAKLALFRGREQINIEADWSMEAFEIEVGDIVGFVNDRYGWSVSEQTPYAKEFEVKNWSLSADQNDGTIKVNMSLQETSEAAFDWAAADGSAIVSNNTSLYDFRDVPSVDLNLYSTSIVSNQELINILNIVTYTSRPAEVDYVEVQYRLATDPDYGSSTTADLGITQVRGVEARSEYAVRARAINAFGIRGSWTEATVYINPVTFQLTDLTNLSVELVNDSLHFNWAEIDDPSLSHFRVRHSPLTDGSALWSDATTDILKVSRPATTVSTPARAGTYMVKAFSKTGQQAPTPASFVIGADEIPATFANTLTIDDSTFSGTLVNAVVNSGRLEIDGTNVISNGTFNSDYWVGWNNPGGWYRTSSFAQASLRDLPERGYVRLPKMMQTTSFPDDSVPVVWQYVSDGAGNWSFYHEQLPYLNPLQQPHPNLPPEGYFNVSLGDAENIKLPMKVGQHSVQFETTTGSGAFEFFRDFEIYAYPNSPFEMLLTDIELVKGPHEYYFANSVNLGSVKFCKITAEVLTERRGDGADVWDGIQGPWDEWVGLFDDWTGDAQPDDTDVELWFRKSDDNSTWSDWRKFRSAVLKTRYIQFKTVLKSTRPNKITPSIETLKVKVEHQ